MSTCSCSQPSKGFGLDWDAPFSFHDDNTFALLDCSTTSSPIYKTNHGNNSTATVPLCDTNGAAVCSLLFSCQAVSRLDTPVATCCVYTPVDLGPSFEMDLQKLQCTSYSGIYGFGGKNDDPASWQYGVALKYKFNYNNEFPTNCENCERSNGACGSATEPERVSSQIWLEFEKKEEEEEEEEEEEKEKQNWRGP
ncbi:hypothetical protein CsSME_00043739 [Camellia sinensis var. sinensis]